MHVDIHNVIKLYAIYYRSPIFTTIIYIFVCDGVCVCGNV